MGQIGHNSGMSPLDAAAAENVQTGVLLLCKEALITAIQDRRLERLHLRVLACIVEHVNRHNALAWPSRQSIAERLGVQPVTVSNTLRELRILGYLIAERKRLPETNNRSLTVYTFGKIDHDTIRSEIQKFVDSIRNLQPKVTACGDNQQTQKSPPRVTDVNTNVTAQGDFQSDVTADGDVEIALSPPGMTFEVTAQGDIKPKVTARGARKSPPAVDSNSIEGTKKKLATQVGAEAPSIDDDLLTQVGDPPALVEITMWKSAIGVKPRGFTKYFPITNQWILTHVKPHDLELARQFVCSEVQQFFMERPKDANGKKLRMMGFITSGFQYRWEAYSKRWRSAEPATEWKAPPRTKSGTYEFEE